MINNSAKRFLSIRLSQDEFDKIQHHLQQSTCRSLTEYVKKVLTRQPVIMKVRDQSREEILHRLGVIKGLMDTLPDKLGPHFNNTQFIHLHYEIHISLREIAKECSR